MQYGELAATYTDLEDTPATLEKVDILADLFANADPDLLRVLVTLSRGRLFAAWESKEIGVSTSLAAEAVAKATGIDVGTVEAYRRETGDIGDAAARAVENKTQQALVTESLDVAGVHESLTALADLEGSGSQGRRVDTISGLLASASPEEARYLVRTVVGTMRLGVGEGAIRDAIAAAFLDGSDAASDAVEAAYQVTNDFRVVAETARDEGRDGLADLGIELFRPVKVMLARKAASAADALEAVGDGDALAEHKYDGMRTQIHADGGDVRVFTRRLEDVTEQFPDLVDAVDAHIDADRVIVEGEAVPYDPETREFRPFQELSQRIKRKYDIEAAMAETPVALFVFDLLVAGDSVLDAPLHERLDQLDAILDPSPYTIERANHTEPSSVADLESFYDDAIAAGHEGLMVKNLEAGYQPGSRVGYMVKLKTTMEPLDLVVPRAKWSEGRKSEWLGRPYLACLDEDADAFREVGRMHSGFTDEELREITSRLEPLVRETRGREVILDPEVVLEVEYEEIQASPTYDSGYALRFPRFVRFRDDLGPRDVDTLDRVERLYEEQ